MSYIKTNWVNNETDLNAQNMNHIENGIEQSYGQILLAVSDTAPSECSTGDKYFDTTTNKIYTATGTNTWGTTGEDAELGVFYIVLDTQNTYTYNGTTLLNVGRNGDVANNYSQDTTIAYSANYFNQCNTYSTTEINTGKKWIDGKPIYRIVEYININTNVSVASLNIDTIVDIKGTIEYVGSSTNGQHQLGGYANASYYSLVQFNKTDNQIQVFCNGYTGKKAYVILEYTKTTD